MSKLNWGSITVGSVLIAVLNGPLASAATSGMVSVFPQVASRGGPITISGSGFGTKGRRYVSIGGQRAWTTTWTDMVAYVPESAPLGHDDEHRGPPDIGGPPKVLSSIYPNNINKTGMIAGEYQDGSRSAWFRVREAGGHHYVRSSALDLNLGERPQ